MSKDFGGDIYALLKHQEEEKEKPLYLPKTLELANSLFLAFIKKNNIVGLKLCILFSGARGQIKYDNENRAKFNVDKLCELLQISKKQLSSNMKKVLEVQFAYIDEEKNAGATVPIHTYEYKNRNKNIHIEVSSKAKSLFTELCKGKYSFSQANANNLMGLKHKHSIRMQLLIEQINNFDENIAKRKRYTLNQINGYFGVNYRSYYEFETKILKPVQEEINNNSKLGFIYELIDETPNGTGRPKIKEVVIDIIEQRNVQGVLKF